MLGTLLVVALFALWVTRPWLRANRQHAQRRTAVEGWGPAYGEPPAGVEDEAVTLRGRLEADGPIARLPGPPAAAATLHGSPTGDGHLVADGLQLRMGSVLVPIEGRVEVFLGSLEEHPKTVPEEAEFRFAESKLGSLERKKDAPKRAQLRRIPSGAEVIVRGHLERRATDGSQYREGAHGWALVTGKHGEPTVLAAAVPKSVRLPRQHWLLRTLSLGFLVFVLVPLGLEHGGEWLTDQGNDQLQECDRGGYRWLTAADGVARLEGVFPAFGDAALDQRYGALRSAVNGVRDCKNSHEAPVDWVDPLIPLARERLPALRDHEDVDSLRTRLEETLHEAGRDREIVELQEDLPPGGEITERVRARLYLGDLDGALATWEEPGAEMSQLSANVLQKGTLLCMARRPTEALEAFDELLDAMRDYESSDRRRSALFRDGLCALRAGDMRRTERRADQLASFELSWWETELLQARIAAVRGELSEWADRQLRAAPAALLVAVALAEDEDWQRLFPFLERSPLDHRLGLGIGSSGADIYDESSYPELDTGQLTALAAALEDAAPELGAAEEPAADRSEDPGEPMGHAQQANVSAASALSRAGEIHRYLAMLYGRRWDPRADAELDEAERLLGADAVTPLRETLAFFHGDWALSRHAQDRDIRNLSRFFRGEEMEPGFAIEVEDERYLGLTFLHPADLRAEHAIAAQYREEPGADAWPSGSSLPWVRAWQRMRLQTDEGTWAEIFYRLTHVVVHGEKSGIDVSDQRAQLRALRALFDSQTDPHLLVGVRSRSTKL